MVLAVYPYKTSHPLPPPRLLLLKFILLIIRTNPWREQNCIISRRIDYKKNVFCELWYIENQSLFFLHITDIILRDFLKTRFSRCVAQCRDWYRLKPVFFWWFIVLYQNLSEIYYFPIAHKGPLKWSLLFFSLNNFIFLGEYIFKLWKDDIIQNKVLKNVYTLHNLDSKFHNFGGWSK